MVVLGVLLVLAAAGTIAFVAVNSSSMSEVSYSAFGYSVSANHLEMFVAGAVVAAVLLLGIAMINSGWKRASVRRRRLREVRHEADDRVARLEEEKRDLQRKLEEEHTSRPDVQPVQPAADHAATDRLVHRDTTRA
ncbi:hypothetical protein [Nonomuraea soli]|uniref:LapA family protein n=1 Tax=Nonomuraea soli TaxID=1032476 RepID=A0A7W0CHU6_9ACTN|nr:hypothetical protein [Nonomuraea soli]MBA2891492.1 hypothetical protein [Nonomuraea soli]